LGPPRNKPAAERRSNPLGTEPLFPGPSQSRRGTWVSFLVCLRRTTQTKSSCSKALFTFFFNPTTCPKRVPKRNAQRNGHFSQPGCSREMSTPQMKLIETETRPTLPLFSTNMSKLKGSCDTPCLRHEVQLSSSTKLCQEARYLATHPRAVMNSWRCTMTFPTKACF